MSLDQGTRSRGLTDLSSGVFAFSTFGWGVSSVHRPQTGVSGDCLPLHSGVREIGPLFGLRALCARACVSTRACVRVHVCASVHVHVHACVSVHVCVHARFTASTRLHLVCACTGPHVCLCIHSRVRAFLSPHACLCVCMCGVTSKNSPFYNLCLDHLVLCWALRSLWI